MKYTRIIAIFMAVAILSLSLVSCGITIDINNGKKTNEDDIKIVDPNEETEPVLTNVMHEGRGIKMLASAPIASDGQIKCVEQDIEAVILPAAAESDLKMVDWEVYWIDNQTGDQTADVNQYITVTPEADGSCRAKVRVFKPFNGSEIGITVYTRRGSYQATCSVFYTGQINDITVYNDDVKMSITAITSIRTPQNFFISGAVKQEKFYNYSGYADYYLPIKCVDLFGFESERNYNNFQITENVKGKIYTEPYVRSEEGDIRPDIYLRELIDIGIDNRCNFFDVSIEEYEGSPAIKLRIYRSSEEFSFAISNNAGVYAVYADPFDLPIFSFTVKEMTSGIEKTISFGILSNTVEEG